MPVTAGLVLSTFTVAVAPAKSAPPKAVHVTLAPPQGVSDENFRRSQPVVLSGGLGSKFQLRFTSPECQVLQPTVLPATLQMGVTSFACAVAATPRTRRATIDARSITVASRPGSRAAP